MLGLGEPDPEVQQLLKSSGGTNLGTDFLSGALGFDPLAFEVSPEEAGRIVWFDALVNNVDRSWRNPNLLRRRGELWLIDHGATMIWHHNWPGAETSAARPYDASDHALRGARRTSPPRRPTSPRASPRTCWPRSPPRSPTYGWPENPASARRPPARLPARCSPAPRHPRPHPGPRGGPVSDLHVYEYAVLHVVPRIERGERINAGVLVYCRPSPTSGPAPTSTRRASSPSTPPPTSPAYRPPCAPSRASARAATRRARRPRTTPAAASAG